MQDSGLLRDNIYYPICKLFKINLKKALKLKLSLLK